MADAASVAAFFDWLEERHSRIDVLVNNASQVYGGHAATLLETDPKVVLDAVQNNAIDAFRMMQRALPVMAQGGYGRIVNLSSGTGALTDMGSGAVPYRTSKTTLNAMTRVAAHEVPTGTEVNAVCPGLVRTDMGGPNATRNVKIGAKGIVWAAMLAEGGFFRDSAEIAWQG